MTRTHTRPLQTACIFVGFLLFSATKLSAQRTFQRIATLPSVLNTCAGQAEDSDCYGETTSAEIVTASEDGMTLIYTDSPTGNIGFIDISDPAHPVPDGLLAMDGEPTSVAVAGDYVLVGVNTSEDFVNTSGYLAVVSLVTRTIVHTIDLGGQPDSVAVSPDRRYAAVAIENERNEEICVGGSAAGSDDEDDCEDGGGEFGIPGQAPAGFLSRIVLSDLTDPETWTANSISLTGIAGRFPGDPEPEYVDINRNNIAVVTLQENNHLALVDLRTSTVINHFSAGSAELLQIDTTEEGIISLDTDLTGEDAVLREPDAVTWINTNLFATADEGDLDGGSRGFTLFSTIGLPVFQAGNSMEHIAARIGHFPESRSGNKGNEAEGIEFAHYATSGKDYLFVGSERSSFIAVYILDQNQATFLQALPAGTGPEGLLAIPSRDLFVVSSEEDDRGVYRGGVTIYKLTSGAPTYPTVQSANDRSTNLPITWAALSALAADPSNPNKAYAVSDSYYSQAAIFSMDVSAFPAVIYDKTVIRRGSTPASDLDLEGIVAIPGGGWWVASEGAGSVDDEARPVETGSRLLRISPSGVITRTVNLPDSVKALQRRFGFEGVTRTVEGGSEILYVAFQREWVDDPNNHVRIGRYNTATGAWTFFYYEISDPESPNGGWVGLSEIVALDGGELLVIERDNQGGPDARIKQLRKFSLISVTPRPQGEEFDVVTRSMQTLVRDLIPDLLSANGYVIEKVEGATVMTDGDVIINTDNDGIEDHSGETQQINLGDIF